MNATSSPRRDVLVVGDDPKLARLIKLALEPGPFIVHAAPSLDDALRAMADTPPSLVAMELSMRSIDGVLACERLRELADVPVIFLSAADDDATKVRALRCGDDYLTRPFSLAELRARVEAVLRRARPCLDIHGPTYRDPLLTIDLGRHEVAFAGVGVELTPTEYRLLAIFARYPGRVFLHEELLSRVWGESYRDDYHLLRLHISNLRRKIEPDPAHPRYIRNRRGLGYVFTPPVASVSTPANQTLDNLDTD